MITDINSLTAEKLVAELQREHDYAIERMRRKAAQLQETVEQAAQALAALQRDRGLPERRHRSRLRRRTRQLGGLRALEAPRRPGAPRPPAGARAVPGAGVRVANRG